MGKPRVVVAVMRYTYYRVKHAREPLYWSTRYGWGDKAVATIYDDTGAHVPAQGVLEPISSIM